MQTAQGILDYLLEQGQDWVDPERTNDRILYGPGEREVSSAVVVWQPTARVIHRARELACQLIVSHEPLFWRVRGNEGGDVRDEEAQAKKERLLDESGITVIRCHDVWDRYPELGIAPSWAANLGFEDYRICDYWDGKIFALCEFEPAKKLVEVAQTIAERTAWLGQQAVTVMGDPDMEISRFTLNIGAWGGSFRHLKDARDRHGSQGAAITEFNWWTSPMWALDTGFGLIGCNHGVSESPGMRSLAEYLGKVFPDLTFTHVPEAAPYLMVGSDGPVTGRTCLDSWETL